MIKPTLLAFLIAALLPITIAFSTSPTYAWDEDLNCDNEFFNSILNECQDLTHEHQSDVPNLQLGGKADLPNLIRFTDNLTLGVEGGKDVVDFDASHGWFAYAKLTWTGTLFDLRK